MSDLLKMLKDGAANYKTLKWPGQNHDIKMRVATEKDMSLATLQADTKFKDRTIGMANAQAYLDYKLSWVLYQIITDPHTSTTLGQFEDFEGLLTADVKDFLDTHHEALQSECSPNPETLSKKELSEMHEELKKNKEETILGICNIFIARQLITYSVAQLLSLQPDS